MWPSAHCQTWVCLLQETITEILSSFGFHPPKPPFLCLWQVLMTEAMMAGDGMTYQKAAIQQWIKDCHAGTVVRIDVMSNKRGVSR